MQRAKQVLQAFKVEMRELPRDAAATYDAKAKAHHATLQKLHGDLQWAKTEGAAAGGGGRSVDEMSSGEIIQEGAGVQDKSKAAVDRMKRQIEDSKQARLRLCPAALRLRLSALRPRRRVHRTACLRPPRTRHAPATPLSPRAPQVGAETAAKLKGQTEQLKNVDQDIMKVKSNLKRADLLLRAFMRRMATDKIFMVFMCLIFCGIIAIIAAKALDVEGTDDLNAPTPDELKSSIGGNDVRRRLRFDRDAQL